MFETIGVQDAVQRIAFPNQSLTGAEVDDDVAKKNCVGNHIEDDPAVIQEWK